MIDIHTHILPGVDDGPSHPENAIEILKKGINEGIKIFVLTPHIRDDSDWGKVNRINEIFISFKNECAERGLQVGLILGAEVLLIPDLIEKIKNNPSITIGGGGKYVLVELPFYQMPVYTENVLFDLLMKGITPILSHIERYRYLNMDNLKRWISNGILLQMNTGSLTGQYGWKVKRTARKFLKNELIHLFGSDVHSFDEGKSLFLQAIKIASKLLNKEKTEHLINFPYRILQKYIAA